MTAKNYQAIILFFNQHPRLKKALLVISALFPIIIFISYSIFLKSIYQNDFLYDAVLIPLFAFLANTLLRRLFNAPRPFEVYNFTPLVKHDKGESFPSRHSTSALIIALTISYIYPTWGTMMIIIALCIGPSRILCGVHFPKDVMAGYLLALLFASFYLFI